MRQYKQGYPICEYDLDGKYIRTWRSTTAVFTVYDISERTIWDALRKKNKTAYGRQWRYLKEAGRKDIDPVALSPYHRKRVEDKIKQGIYNHDYFVPLELLYLYDKDNPEDLIERLEAFSKKSRVSNNDKELIQDVINYLFSTFLE